MLCVPQEAEEGTGEVDVEAVEEMEEGEEEGQAAEWRALGAKRTLALRGCLCPGLRPRCTHA